MLVVLDLMEVASVAVVAAVNDILAMPSTSTEGAFALMDSSAILVQNISNLFQFLMFFPLLSDPCCKSTVAYSID